MEGLIGSKWVYSAPLLRAKFEVEHAAEHQSQQSQQRIGGCRQARAEARRPRLSPHDGAHSRSVVVDRREFPQTLISRRENPLHRRRQHSPPPHPLPSPQAHSRAPASLPALPPARKSRADHPCSELADPSSPLPPASLSPLQPRPPPSLSRLAAIMTEPNNAAPAAAASGPANTSGGQSFTDAQVDEYREQDRWLPVSFSQGCGLVVKEGQDRTPREGPGHRTGLAGALRPGVVCVPGVWMSLGDCSLCRSGCLPRSLWNCPDFSCF